MEYSGAREEDMSPLSPTHPSIHLSLGSKKGLASSSVRPTDFRDTFSKCSFFFARMLAIMVGWR